MTLTERARAAAREFRIVDLNPRRGMTPVEEDAQRYADTIGLGDLHWSVEGERAIATHDGLTFDYSRRLFSRGADRFWFDHFHVIRACPTCGEPDAITLSARGALVSLGLMLDLDRHPYHRKPWIA